MKKYSDLEKILHRQFLGTNALTGLLYERLISKGAKDYSVKKDNHIFITGLARAGTTALLNKLYFTNEFNSFVYKYMPFILSPRLAIFYSSFFSEKSDTTTKRFHNDGIKINQDSPECLDEIYWIKSKPNYFKSELSSDEYIPDRILIGYSYLIDRYKLVKNKRMLIKNNNNHIRLEKLSKHFTGSIFLVMFREPIAHSNSLLSQHLNFTRLQHEEPFILEYMNLIGHREFGLNAKPFLYGSDNKTWFKDYKKDDINYWLSQWISTYEWILTSGLLLRNNIFLISYENLCEYTSTYNKICELVNVSNSKNIRYFNSGNLKYSRNNELVNSSLQDTANLIYKKLLEKSIR